MTEGAKRAGPRGGAWACALAAIGGCAPEAPPWTPPLLGQRSPAMIAHLAGVCPQPLAELTLGVWTSPLTGTPSVDPGELYCAAPGADFQVRFDWRGRVQLIELREFADERAAEALFDRAIAPIVPADQRDAIRASIRATADLRQISGSRYGTVDGSGGRLIMRASSWGSDLDPYVGWVLRVPTREDAPRGSEPARTTPLGRLSALRIAAWSAACAAPLEQWTVGPDDPSVESESRRLHTADPDRWHVLRRPVGSQIVQCAEARRAGGQPIGWRVEADRADRIYRITVMDRDAEALRARAAAAIATHLPRRLRAEATASIERDPPFRPPLDEETGRLAVQVSRASELGWGAELMWWVLPALLLEREP